MMLRVQYYLGSIQVLSLTPSITLLLLSFPKPKILSMFKNTVLLVCAMSFIRFFSKVLANRLKKILPTIITEHQSAFVKDRLITDNILVDFESLHCMRKYNSGDPGFMAIKLEMNKAYDRVEWLYL